MASRFRWGGKGGSRAGQRLGFASGVIRCPAARGSRARSIARRLPTCCAPLCWAIQSPVVAEAITSTVGFVERAAASLWASPLPGCTGVTGAGAAAATPPTCIGALALFSGFLGGLERCVVRRVPVAGVAGDALALGGGHNVSLAGG